MKRQGFALVYSSSPGSVLLRLVIFTLACNLSKLFSLFALHSKRLRCSQHSGLHTIAGLVLVTGCPLRQICNVLRNAHFYTSANRVPGPLLAKASRLWKIWHVLNGDFHIAIRAAHAKYGQPCPCGLVAFKLTIDRLRGATDTG